jgi:hypothetical protein
MENHGLLYEEGRLSKPYLFGCSHDFLDCVLFE